ncbi:hypothetical protein ACFL0M_15885 [Thermodesulfobacteriota bacterium]
MVLSVHTPWEEIAWNGIRFLAPPDWEIGQIGNQYLMLEQASAPILEMKWGHIRGTFSHRTYFQRLAVLQKGQPGNTFSEYTLPGNWEKALGSYEAIGFSWRGETIGGKGLILYCPTCMNATLIQFYQNDNAKTDTIPQHLLATFQDHRPDDQMRWSVFDIRATMPANLKIVRYRFEAGQFELAFASKAHTIFLTRWGPASILLADRNLDRFAESVLHLPATKLVTTLTPGKQAVVEWINPATPNSLTQWLGRMKIKPSLQRLRLWHLTGKNRILGVRAEGKRPIDLQFFENICAGFESV